MKQTYRAKPECRLCNSAHLLLAIPLRPLPVESPNVGYIAEESAHETAPADVMVCADCGHLQLSHIVDATLQYDNFLYTTGVSLGLADHFRAFVESVHEQKLLPVGSLVVEIGSNDGTLLAMFKGKGHEVLGVDPARKIAEDATARGVPTMAEYFTLRLAEQISGRSGKASLVISNNTVANLDDLSDLAKGIQHLMAEDGMFVLETQYAVSVLDKFLLDVIYHEHVSYFSVSPTIAYLDRLGMELFDVELIAPKGGSVRFYVQHKGAGRPVSSRVGEIVAAEQSRKLTEPAAYAAFNEQLAGLRQRVSEVVQTSKAAGKTVAAYGSSVGCAALMHQFDLLEQLDCVFDDNPFKTRMPGTNKDIPIYKGADLAVHAPDVLIILAWRYTDAILAKNGRLLKPGIELYQMLPSFSRLNPLPS
jgi:SAM-dependent methyltransferase